MSKLLIWLEPFTKITKHIGKNLLYDMITELFIDDSNTMIFKCLLGGDGHWLTKSTKWCGSREENNGKSA